MRLSGHVTLVVLSALALGEAPAWGQSTPGATASTGTTVDTMTLHMMLDKGVITQAEYDSAVHDLLDSSGRKAGESNNVVIGKWSATLYGFAEADYIEDSTQSFSDLAGAGQVARPGTYVAGNPRSQFSVRNSRFGFRFRAPEYRRMRATAQVEADFLGDWANPTYSGATGQPSENQFFTNPALRLRHAFLKVENPVVDILFGQTWDVFGGGGLYHPNSVQIQGIPGEIYARTPQLRLSKTIGNKDVSVDIVAAAMRAPNRDSGVPEGQGELRFAVNRWTGAQTIGATGTTVSPASIAVSGDVRTVAVSNFPQDAGGKSTFDTAKVGGAIAVDAFIPVLPASKEHLGNSLSLLGEFVTGQGIGDLYTGLSGGVVYPTATVAAGDPVGSVASVYNPQADPGLAGINPVTGAVTLINWQTIRGGLQYYFPGVDGRMWLTANYANVTMPNASTFLGYPSSLAQGIAAAKATATTPAITAVTPVAGKLVAPTTVRNALNFFDVALMGDLTPAVRLGIEYAYYVDKYMDGVSAPNHRVQASAFYIF
jgi:hypothetical protein